MKALVVHGLNEQTVCASHHVLDGADDNHCQCPALQGFSMKLTMELMMKLTVELAMAPIKPADCNLMVYAHCKVCNCNGDTRLSPEFNGTESVAKHWTGHNKTSVQ